MRSVSSKNFFISGLYYFWQTWPYGFGEVFTEALLPIVKRIVFLLLLLGNFRYLSKNARPGLSYPEMFELLLPVLLSVLAVVLLPLILDALNKLSARRRKKLTTEEIQRKYCHLLFEADRGRRKWKLYYDGQRVIVVYVIYMLMISPVFFYYNWHLAIVYLVSTILFGTVCAIKYEFASDSKPAYLFNRFINSGAYINTMRNLVFSLYIVACAVVIVLQPKKIPIEFIFVIIVGMRLTLSRGKNVISFFHWEADNGVVVGEPVKKD